jgi:phosphatidylglycerophosphatase A
VRRLALVASTWFGTGLSPVAPGTVGTLATLPLVALLWWAAPGWVHALVALGVSATAVWAARDARRIWGRDDPSQVVIDEAAGMLVASAFLPPSALALVTSFALFRAADILKPWPVSRLERLPGAWGILLDDLAAGVIANLATRLVLWAVEKWA